MDQLSTYIPNFDFSYFTTISLLVFAVGGCEKISPYVNQTRNPAKEFPKGMIVMAIMVGLSAILGSVAMGMLFDGNNIPEDLMRNGAYQAFQMLGNSWILLPSNSIPMATDPRMAERPTMMAITIIPFGNSFAGLRV